MGSYDPTTVPLDPQLQPLADSVAASGSNHGATVEEMRNGYELIAALAGPPAELPRIEEITVAGAAGELPARLYAPAPESEGPLPVVVYFHVGGFTIGSVQNHDPLCRQLALASGAMVISVEYRLAPEHPFPAAAEDAIAATRSVTELAPSLGGDPRRLAVAGNSAGGNLAIVSTLAARDADNTPPIRFQLLINPTVDFRNTPYPSYEENRDALILDLFRMEWFFEHYVGDESKREHPWLSPIAVDDLSGLPPALVITSELDPLRDEGEAYGARLQEAGVPVTVTRYDGVVHDFMHMGGFLDKARRAIDEAGAALRDGLG
jgi:acetyl esterase